MLLSFRTRTGTLLQWLHLHHHKTTRGMAAVSMASASQQEKKVWSEKRGEKRAAREALTVASRVMESQEDSVRRALARKSTKLLPSALLELLTDRIHRGQWEAALKVFDLLRAQQWYEPYAGTYIRMLEMLGKCKRPKEAKTVYSSMIADGVAPSREAFTALISVYTRNKLLKNAFEIVEAMKVSPHCSPDVFTYSLLIKACCDNGQLTRAGHLLSEMSSRGVEPNVVTYNIIIDAYGKAGMVNELERVAERMMGGNSTSKPDNWTRNAIVKGFGNNGLIHKMEEWFEKLTRAGEAPDSLTLHSLMSAYGKAEQFDKMHSVLRYIHKYHYEVDAVTYNILINAYGRSGRMIQMDKTFTSMKCSGVKPDSVTYCTLINYYGKYGMLHKLHKLLDVMLLHKVQPDTALYNSVLDAFRRASDIPNLEKYLVRMKDMGCKPDHLTYNIVISAYRSNGLHDKANVMAIEQEKLKQEEAINKALVSTIKP